MRRLRVTVIGSTFNNQVNLDLYEGLKKHYDLLETRIDTRAIHECDFCWYAGGQGFDTPQDNFYFGVAEALNKPIFSTFGKHLFSSCYIIRVNSFSAHDMQLPLQRYGLKLKLGLTVNCQ